MTPTRVVVLGAGYAGTSAVKRLESELGGGGEIVWISDRGHHVVRHEVHRIIRDPGVRSELRVPIREIKGPETVFRRGEVVAVDPDDRTVMLTDGSSIEYDYALVALGSRPAYFGVDGLEEHAHTVTGLRDALALHNAIGEASRNASEFDPARIVIGGGGLTGVQSAGEIAAMCDENDFPIEIALVEASEEIAANHDPRLRDRLRENLTARDIEIRTGNRIDRVGPSEIYFETGSSTGYDVFVWTGGIAGPDAITRTDLERERTRLRAETTFETSDERIFAVGDAALIDPGDADPVPPTAEAAWEGGVVAGENLARAIRGESLRQWSYSDSGTLVSIGETTVAHGIDWSPFATFGGPAARCIKKAVASRWVGSIASWRLAARLWPVA